MVFEILILPLYASKKVHFVAPKLAYIEKKLYFCSTKLQKQVDMGNLTITKPSVSIDQKTANGNALYRFKRLISKELCDYRVDSYEYLM